jgi:hypothetical protein
MDTKLEFTVILTFDEYSKVGEFISDMQNWKEHKLKKAEKKMDDKRGKHTKGLHIKARHYHELNPDIPYRECMKLIRME